MQDSNTSMARDLADTTIITDDEEKLKEGRLIQVKEGWCHRELASIIGKGSTREQVETRKTTKETKRKIRRR